MNSPLCNDVRGEPDVFGVHQHPVLAFFVAMFAWSWGYWGLLAVTTGSSSITYWHTLPGLWGPAVAAVVVTWLLGNDVRAFLARSLRLGVGRRWLVVAIGGPIAIGTALALVRIVLGDVEPRVAVLSPLLALVVAIFAGGSEELGLRGHAHPRLRDRYDGLLAGLVVGVVWAVWHVPLQRLGVGSDVPFVLFALATVGLSVLMGWLYDATGSVLLAVLAHAAIDAPGLVSPSGQVTDDVAFQAALVGIVLYWAIVAGLVAKNGTRLTGTATLPGPANERSRAASTGGES